MAATHQRASLISLDRRQVPVVQDLLMREKRHRNHGRLDVLSDDSRCITQLAELLGIPKEFEPFWCDFTILTRLSALVKKRIKLEDQLL